jgi:DNA-binding transcriptional MocR family regulator
VPGEDIHVWLTLPSYWTSAELAETAHAEGLAITPSDVFHTGAPPPNAIRLSLGSIRERNRLAAALRKLSHLLARKPAARRGIVV